MYKPGNCNECDRAAAAHWAGGVTGWFTGPDGVRHNHLRGPSAMNAHRLRSRVQAPPVTEEELSVARQMGVSRSALVRQKQLDAAAHLEGRISALELISRQGGQDA